MKYECRHCGEELDTQQEIADHHGKEHPNKLYDPIWYLHPDQDSQLDNKAVDNYIKDTVRKYISDGEGEQEFTIRTVFVVRSRNENSEFGKFYFDTETSYSNNSRYLADDYSDEPVGKIPIGTVEFVKGTNVPEAATFWEFLRYLENLKARNAYWDFDRLEQFNLLEVYNEFYEKKKEPE